MLAGALSVNTLIADTSVPAVALIRKNLPLRVEWIHAGMG